MVHDTTYTLPVGGDARPSHITGRLVFRMFDSTDQSDRWLHARFYFDPVLWDVDEHGFVYTDHLFVDNLHARLRARGWTNPEQSINYSESGMQGRDFVDFDVTTDNNTLMDLLITGTPVHKHWPEHVRTRETA